MSDGHGRCYVSEGPRCLQTTSFFSQELNISPCKSTNELHKCYVLHGT